MLLIVVLLTKVVSLLIGARYYATLVLPYKILFWQLALALIAELCGLYISSVLRQQNAWFFNFYIIAELWMLAMASIHLTSAKSVQRFAILTICTGTAIWIWELATDSIYSFATTAMISGSALLTVLYFAVLLTSDTFSSKKIMLSPVFWVSVSTILYFSCIIPYMGLNNYLAREHPKVGAELGFINLVLNIVRYPLVAVGFIVASKRYDQLK